MRDCLFVWVPKCAGTSVFSVLETQGCRKIKDGRDFSRFNNTGSVTFGHVGIEQLIKAGYVSQEYLEQAFVFAFVRNPWDRMVSLWSYLRKNRILGPGCEFRDFVQKVDEGVHPVGLYNRKGLSQARPMYDWIIDSAGSKIPDFIGKVEEPADFKFLSGELGLDCEFPVMNKSEHRGYREYYTPETRDMVGRMYESDVDEFKYSF